MSWNILPIELRVCILSMRHDMREDSQKMIVRHWEKFQAPKKVAQYLVNKERMGLPMGVMFPEVASIMEYCANVLSGREKPNYWRAILEEVEHEMWLNQYSGGPGAEYMGRVDDAFMILIDKFKYAPKWQEFQQSFYGI